MARPLSFSGLLALALIAGITPAIAQTFPTVPSQSVIGRLGTPGVSGPSSAIPFATLQSQLSGPQSANTVNAGPTSGAATFSTFRALVGADLPNPGASSKGGVQSKTCAANQWLNTISVAGVPACAQPAIADISGFGTGVATALGVNVGTAGSPVINGGALGTPSSGSLPISTGISGLGTGVATFLATPSSANLRAALTDETGTGAAVFADGNIGAATGTSLVVSGTAGLGYATGAGSTVTQITNRTNPVTINKPSGAITMFSAAGSATAATFTVNNSSVVATDTIILNQKSATNLYNFMVGSVNAGSFTITFFTTGGTATDSPVINFNVIKGVSS